MSDPKRKGARSSNAEENPDTSEATSPKSERSTRPAHALFQCYCSWPDCNEMQQELQRLKDEYGIIEWCSMVRPSVTQNQPSEYLKSAIDRVLDLKAEHRKWIMKPGRGGKYVGTVRYQIAAHHWLPALVTRNANLRKPGPWSHPLTADEADQYLYAYSDQDRMHDAKRPREELYVQVPNVPRDFVRDYIRRAQVAEANGMQPPPVPNLPRHHKRRRTSYALENNEEKEEYTKEKEDEKEEMMEEVEKSKNENNAMDKSQSNTNKGEEATNDGEIDGNKDNAKFDDKIEDDFEEEEEEEETAMDVLLRAEIRRHLQAAWEAQHQLTRLAWAPARASSPSDARRGRRVSFESRQNHSQRP